MWWTSRLGPTVTGLTAVADMAMRINGGYFVLRQGIFDYLNEGEDLVMDACIRAAEGRPDARGAVRRVLGADGHAQGAQRARRPCTGGATARGRCGEQRPVQVNPLAVPVLEIDPAVARPRLRSQRSGRSTRPERCVVTTPPAASAGRPGRGVPGAASCWIRLQPDIARTLEVLGGQAAIVRVLPDLLDALRDRPAGAGRPAPAGGSW